MLQNLASGYELLRSKDVKKKKKKKRMQYNMELINGSNEVNRVFFIKDSHKNQEHPIRNVNKLIFSYVNARKTLVLFYIFKIVVQTYRINFQCVCESLLAT